MLVFDQVPDEFFACVCVEWVGGIGHTGAIRDEFLYIVKAQALKFVSWLAVGKEFNIHLRLLRSLSVSGWIISATDTISTTKSTSRMVSP